MRNISMSDVSFLARNVLKAGTSIGRREVKCTVENKLSYLMENEGVLLDIRLLFAQQKQV